MTVGEVDHVIDASVAINILATTRGVEVLGALPGRCVIEERAAAEVTRHPRGITHAQGPLGELLSSGALKVVQMVSEDFELFVQLVGAPSPDGLDDGEAASLAWVVGHGGVLIVDDGKARRITRRDYSAVEMQSSVSVFRAWAERAKPTPAELATVLQDAKKHGRMRVLVDDRAWFESKVM